MVAVLLASLLHVGVLMVAAEIRWAPQSPERKGAVPVVVLSSSTSTGAPAPSGGGDTSARASAPAPEQLPSPALPAEQPARPVKRNQLRPHRVRAATSRPIPAERSGILPKGELPSGSVLPSEGIAASPGTSASAGGDGRQPGTGQGGGGGTAAMGDARAYCVYCPPPRYPVFARQRNWSGAVAVALVLDAGGSVREAYIERSSGFDVLDHEALTAARQSRFRLPGNLTPPLRGRIHYRFELTE